jgi:hypothetical protein
LRTSASCSVGPPEPHQDECQPPTTQLKADELLGRPSCQPATANAAPSPSRPARCRQATTPPADHGGTSTPCAQPGRPATPSHPGSSARTARRQRRRHQRLSGRTPGYPGRLDTGHLDAGCPLDRLDGHPHGGPDTADRQRPARPASGHPRDRRHPLGGPTSPGSRRPGALGHPGRLRGDGTRAAALTTAATGQLPSTARHQAAPRRTAVVGKVCGPRVVRNGDGHPLWRAQCR